MASRVVSCGTRRRWWWWLAIIIRVVCCGLGRGHSTCCGLGSLRSSCSQRQSCNGAEWSKDKTQAAESIKWRPQQAYGSNQFLLVQPQTVFSTHTKSSCSRIDKRTARATGNTRYRYSKIAPLDHKMADNCVSLARTNTLSSTITKPIKT